MKNNNIFKWICISIIIIDVLLFSFSCFLILSYIFFSKIKLGLMMITHSVYPISIWLLILFSAEFLFLIVPIIAFQSIARVENEKEISLFEIQRNQNDNTEIVNPKKIPQEDQSMVNIKRKSKF